MGFAQYQPNSPINNKPAYAFDQQFAYIFAGGFWQQAVDSRGSAYNPLWHGIDTNFFWTCNWQGNILNPSPPPVLSYEQALFVSNFYTVNPNGAGDATNDPIWYWTDSTWNKYQPYVHPSGAATVDGPYVATALLMVAFKGRLILLNTIENDGTGDDVSTFGFNTQHQNRARWSHTGSPFAANPSDPLSINNAFFEGESYVGSTPAVAADGGDYLDAATDEAIISCEFIKDALIVQFERSTWELSFTNNELVPFIWRKLNTELGCESTFSSVPFDQFILSVGQTGVHACNGSNVERIDAKIPDEVFKIKNPSDGTKRVHGIRDYFTEMVYWTFPRSNQRSTQPYPQRILVYNYQNKSWAFNDDSITTFGYFEQQQGATWASSRIPWESGKLYMGLRSNSSQF